MGRIITDPAVRKAIYTVVTALVPILVGAGIVTEADAGKYVALGGALLGMLTTILAAVNTAPAAYVPRHADDGDDEETFDPGDHLQIIPADQATSDPKSDAAGL